MPSELQRPARSAKSGGSRRDSSPDSLIFTPESNLSFFSSASVSVDRSSPTSDAHDRDSLVSAPSLERDQRDLDPDKRGTGWKHSRNSRKSNKVKAWKEEFEVVNKEDESQNLDSARSSFSVALRECQERKSRTEALAKKLDNQRPTSLDLSNVTSSSPRVVTVKRASVSTNKSSVFPSPGTPTYLHSMQKGWSSERVALRSNGGRSPPNAGFLPLYSGRTVPSKWEDAERWILSPLAREGAPRTSFTASHERRPKSKSGPLGPPGVAYYTLYSPVVPMVHGENLTASSPFSAGALPENGCSRGSGAAAFPQRTDHCMARSVSIHGCSETLAPSSLLSQDEIHESIKDAATDARAVSRRDMATQMSPEGSIRLSPERQCSSFSPSSPTARSIVEILNARTKRAEAKDLQVDEKVTVTRWSKRHRALYHGDSSKMRDHLHGEARDPQGLAWAKTEEARIISWENLQKAKAEAKIRKLEMKLEKKRSSSMEKIMRKVKSAEKKADEMRKSVLDNRVVSNASSRGKSLCFRRSGKKKIVSLSGCFTCHAYFSK
uniref:Remorin C-terminal domain-containing protein n=1 Tax=Noccaea caerulescens TaxID=107243 RepID=A0A1J3K0H2_NOCCA